MYNQELIALLDEMEEVAYRRGYLRARIEHHVNVLGALVQASPPRPVAVQTRAEPDSTRSLVRSVVTQRMTTTDIVLAVQTLNPEIRPSTIRTAIWALRQDGTLERLGKSMYGPPSQELTG